MMIPISLQKNQNHETIKIIKKLINRLFEVINIKLKNYIYPLKTQRYHRDICGQCGILQKSKGLKNT